MAYEKPDRYPCPFCELITNRIPSAIVAKNELAIAFMAVNRRSVGAVMISPIRHVEEISKLTKEEAQCIMELIRLIGKKVINIFDPDGIHLFCNAGKRAGQSVCHMHIQIQTRFYNDDYLFIRAIDLPWIPVKELRKGAKKIGLSKEFDKPEFIVPEKSIFSNLSSPSNDEIILEVTTNFQVAVPQKTRTLGAIVIVPKIKIQNVFLLDDQQSEELILLIRKYCRLIENTYDPIGLSVWCETGEVADQIYAHFIVEIVPYHKSLFYKYRSRNKLPIMSYEDRLKIKTEILAKNIYNEN